MTAQEITNWKNKLDNMSQIELARLWRFAESGCPVFDSTLPIYEHFQKCFKGFTPEISKIIGWEK
jgi:hypothetical protein